MCFYTGTMLIGWTIVYWLCMHAGFPYHLDVGQLCMSFAFSIYAYGYKCWSSHNISFLDRLPFTFCIYVINLNH